MAVARRLLFRLFLEGVEVPVVGARISVAEGAPSAALIQVVPTDRVLDLHPRTMVHMFALDIVSKPADGDTLPVADIRRDSVAVLANYKLIFHGVYVGFRVLKEGARRQTILQCVGPSSVWDSVHQYSLTYGPRGGAWGNRFTDDAEVVLFDDITGNPAEATAKLMQSKPKYSELREVEEGVLAGVLAICEAVGGVPDAYKGVNDFTTVEELRIHVLDQLAFVTQDETALKLFSRTAFKKWLKNQLGRMGALASIRDIINLVLAYVYHRVSVNPAPKFEPGGAEYTTEEDISASNLSDEAQELVEDLIESLRDLDTQTTEAYTQATGGEPFGGYSGLGPQDDSEYGGQIKVLFPADAHNAYLGLSPIASYVVAGPVGASVDMEHSAVTYAHAVYPSFLSHAQYITKLGMSCEQVKRVIRRGLVPLVSGTVPSVMENLERCIAELGKAANYTPTTTTVVAAVTHQENGQWVSGPTSGSRFYYPGDAKTVVDTPEYDETTAGTSLWAMQEFLRQAIDHLEAANGTHPETVTHNHVANAKLKTLIIRPDVWFVPPPRCNVLFPEQYTRFEMTRNHMQEVSRYQIRAGLEQKKSDTLEWYYSAPNLSDYLEKDDKYFRESPAILPHEEYTGIIAKTHSMQDMALYLTETEKANTLEAAGEGKDRVAFTQRVAHYNFYMYRFAARTARVTALFNYHLVCGFPLLLIDKPFLTPYDANTSDLLWAAQHGLLETVIAQGDIPWGGLPNQFLGTISSMDHNIDQDGGGTVLHLTHVRTHRSVHGTDDEFLNARIAEEGQSLEKVKAFSVILNFDQLMAAGNMSALNVLRDCTPNPALHGLGETPDETPVPVKSAGPGSKVPALGIDPNSTLYSPEQLAAGTAMDCFIKLGELVGRWEGLMSAVELRKLKADPSSAKVKFLRSNGIMRRETVQGEEWNFYDTVTLVIEGKIDIDAEVMTAVPVEEAIRPDWVGEAYGNEKIGEEVYQNFFGTGSIVDEQIFLVESLAATVEANEAVRDVEVDEDGVKKTYTAGEYDETHIEYGAISNQTPSGAPITDVAVVARDADGILSNLGAVETESETPRTTSIAMATDALSIVYGMAILNNLDVTRFVWEYGYRPVATLLDIFGDPSFQVDDTGAALSQQEIDDAARSGLGTDQFTPARTADEVLSDWSRYGKGYVSPALEDADKRMLEERWARIQAGSVGGPESLGDFDVVPPLDVGGELTSTAPVAPATSVDDAPEADSGLGPAPETVDAWEEEAQEVAELEAEIAGATVEAPDEGAEYPREGFHSRALTDLSGLVGLITDEAGTPIDLSGKTYNRRDGLGEKEPISPTVDHRVDRKKRVLDYLESLQLRGIRG